MDCNEKHAIWLIVGMPMVEGLDGGGGLVFTIH